MTSNNLIPSQLVEEEECLSSSLSTVQFQVVDAKYKNYVSAIDKALKNFEYSSEWPDLISALSKLNKVITVWTARYGDLARLQLVTKRLSQCLHPNLPSGVHLKALETYDLVFKSINNDNIAKHLFSFAAGLFPLWTYASMTLRPVLLNIYETHLTPFITPPSLEGFLISIFSGLSEYNDSSDTELNSRISKLLSEVEEMNPSFNLTLWSIISSNPKIRLSGINYILSNNKSEENQIVVPTWLCINCLISCLSDTDILVQRASLELILNHYPLDKEIVFKEELIKGSLFTLLRRDMSLNRRLFSWFGDKVFFEQHVKRTLLGAIRGLLDTSGGNNFDFTEEVGEEVKVQGRMSQVQIARVLVSLLDKVEIEIIDELLLDVVQYFANNVQDDSDKVANLFFSNLDAKFVFDELLRGVTQAIKSYGHSNFNWKSGVGVGIGMGEDGDQMEKEPIGLEGEQLEPIGLEGEQLEPIGLEGEQLETIGLEGEQLEPIGLEGEQLETIGLEGEQLEPIEIEGEQLEPIEKEQDASLEQIKNDVGPRDLTKENMELRDSSTPRDGSLEAASSTAMSDTLDNIVQPSMTSLKLEMEEKGLKSATSLLNSTSLLKYMISVDLPCFEYSTLLPPIYSSILRQMSDLTEENGVNFLTESDWMALINLLDQITDKININTELFQDITFFYSIFNQENVMQYPTTLQHQFPWNTDATDYKQDQRFHDDQQRLNPPPPQRFNDPPPQRFDAPPQRFDAPHRLDLAEPPLAPLSNLHSLLNKILDVVDLSTDTNQSEVGSWLKKLVILSCKGNKPAIKTLLALLKTNKLYRHEILTKTDVIKLVTKILWKSNDFNLLETLLSLSKAKVEKILLTYLSSYKSFEKLKLFLKNVNLTDVRLLIFKLLENLKSENLLLKKQAEEFVISELKKDASIVEVIVSSFPQNTWINSTMQKANSTPDIFLKVNQTQNKFNKSTGDLNILQDEEVEDIVIMTHFKLTNPYDHDRLIYMLKKIHNLIQLDCSLFVQALIDNFKEKVIFMEYLFNIFIDYLITLQVQDLSDEEADLLHVQVQCLVVQICRDILQGVVNFKQHSSAAHVQITIMEMLTRLKFQKTILQILHSTLTDFNNPSLLYTEQLVKANYLIDGVNYAHILQGHLVRLLPLLISLESLVTTTSHPLVSNPLLLNLISTSLSQDHAHIVCDHPHFTMTDMILSLPQTTKNHDQPLKSLTVSKLCKNLQKPHPLEYQLRALKFLIEITSENPPVQNSNSKPTPQNTSIYGLLTSLLPTVTTPTDPKSTISTTLPPLDLLLKTCLYITSKETSNLIITLLNPLAERHTFSFINSLSLITPSGLLVKLISDLKSIKPQDLFNISLLNKNLVNFMDKYLGANPDFEPFPSSALILLVKECWTKSVGIETVLDIVLKSFEKLEFNKAEMKEIQDYSFKILEKLANESTNNEQYLIILARQLPEIVDLIYDNDKEKLMPLLSHLIYNILPFLKIRHSPFYLWTIKLLCNLSKYSSLRKSWKKDIFEFLLLDPTFFSMNPDCIDIWKTILDNLFTLNADKSTFSELLTRVSVPQTTTLNIFTSKETEYEGRAMLLKRLAFVIWSSEQDQFCKFITNIQERLAEALKTPTVHVPIQISVFICFRILILKFSYMNLSALWPIIIHEMVQVLLLLEKMLNSCEELSTEWLQLSLETFKLIQLLLSLPPTTLPLFQMYKWAFLGHQNGSGGSSSSLGMGFRPYLSRLSNLIPQPQTQAKVPPSDIRILTTISDMKPFLDATTPKHYNTYQIDLDFIENNQ